MQELKILHTKLFDAVEIPPSKQVLTLFIEKGILSPNQDAIRGGTILKGARLYYTIPDAFIKKDSEYEVRFLPFGNGLWLVVSMPKGSKLISNFNKTPMFFVQRPADKRNKNYPVVALILGDEDKPINPKKVIGVI